MEGESRKGSGGDRREIQGSQSQKVNNADVRGLRRVQRSSGSGSKKITTVTENKGSTQVDGKTGGEGENEGREGRGKGNG